MILAVNSGLGKIIIHKSPMTSLRRNIPLLYAFSFLQMTLFPMAIITLFWKDRIGLRSDPDPPSSKHLRRGHGGDGVPLRLYQRPGRLPGIPYLRVARSGSPGGGSTRSPRRFRGSSWRRSSSASPPPSSAAPTAPFSTNPSRDEG